MFVFCVFIELISNSASFTSSLTAAKTQKLHSTSTFMDHEHKSRRYMLQNINLVFKGLLQASLMEVCCYFPYFLIRLPLLLIFSLCGFDISFVLMSKFLCCFDLDSLEKDIKLGGA